MYDNLYIDENRIKLEVQQKCIGSNVAHKHWKLANVLFLNVKVYVMWQAARTVAITRRCTWPIHRLRLANRIGVPMCSCAIAPVCDIHSFPTTEWRFRKRQSTKATNNNLSFQTVNSYHLYFE